MKRKDIKIRRTIHVGDIVFKVLVTLLMSLFALTFIYLLLWMIFSSFRPTKAFGEDRLAFWKLQGASLKNYKDAFAMEVKKTNILGMIKNSLILIVGICTLQAIIPVLCGYVVAKYKTKINGLIINLVIVSMVVPSVGTMTATYRFMSTVGLRNSFLGLFIMNAGGLGFSMLLYRNYFAAISWEFAESAFLDGAGNLKVFFYIMYPQALPLIVSMAILNIIGVWNDYMTPYLYLPDYPTVALGVQQIFVKAKTNYPKSFAAMSLMTVVVLAIYAAFSKTIMKSMSVGGIKG